MCSADWGAIATISTRKDVESFPFANLISISDGSIGNGTGIPYMYLTPLDYVAQDLAVSIIMIINININLLAITHPYTYYTLCCTYI